VSFSRSFVIVCSCKLASGGTGSAHYVVREHGVSRWTFDPPKALRFASEEAARAALALLAPADRDAARVEVAP
jgi:hypothetical protein